jgi:hypothetical protein
MLLFPKPSLLQQIDLLFPKRVLVSVIALSSANAKVWRGLGTRLNFNCL